MRASLPTASLLSASVAVALLLSGCGGVKAKEVVPDPYLQPVGFSDTTGVIKGYVVDEEFQPLRDSVVGFIDPYQATKTNEAGEFEIGQLHPGKRNLYVIHLGHKSAGKRIEILAQQETIVTFVLPVLPVEEPWIDVVQKVGKFDKALVVDPVPTSVNKSISPAWRLKDDPKALQGLHMDVVWNQGQGLAGGMRVVLQISREDKGTIFSVSGKNPLRASIDRAGIEEVFSRSKSVCIKDLCRLEWEATPDTNMTNLAIDVGVMLEQSFEVWVAHAYRQALPEGYQASP
jgi:hypothetical protein